MRLVLLGPPGAGKGTQAKVLSQKLNLVHLSTGDIFRESTKRSDEIGQRLTGYMQRGQLVPDEIVNQIVIEKLKDKRIQNRFILDGYPRTKAQSTSLDKFLAIKFSRSFSYLSSEDKDLMLIGSPLFFEVSLNSILIIFEIFYILN